MKPPLRRYAVQPKGPGVAKGCVTWLGVASLLFLVAIMCGVAALYLMRPRAIYTAKLRACDGEIVLWYRADHLPRADGLSFGREACASDGIRVDIVEKRLEGMTWRYLCVLPDGRGGWADVYQLDDVRGAD